MTKKSGLVLKRRLAGPAGGLLAALKEVLAEASEIHRAETKLQQNQGMSISVQSPHDPENIAEDEAPESDHAPSWTLGTYEPRSYDGHGHRRPLNEIYHLPS